MAGVWTDLDTRKFSVWVLTEHRNPRIHVLDGHNSHCDPDDVVDHSDCDGLHCHFSCHHLRRACDDIVWKHCQDVSITFPRFTRPTYEAYVTCPILQ